MPMRQARVEIKQFCDHCKQYHVHRRTVSAHRKRARYGMLDDSLAAAALARGLERRIEKKIARIESRYGYETYGVLCPYCGKFKSKALKRHFPRGFRAGIIRRANRRLVWAGIGAILSGTFFAACFVGALWHGDDLIKRQLAQASNPNVVEYYWVFWVAAIVALAVVLVGMPLGLVVEPAYERFRLLQLLRRLTEEDLHNIMVNVYKEGHGQDSESLAIPFVRTGAIVEYLRRKDARKH